MTTLDWVLAVGIWSSSILMAAIGIEMTVTPPVGEHANLKWAYRASFIFFGMVFIVFSVWQLRRNQQKDDLATQQHHTEQVQYEGELNQQIQVLREQLKAAFDALGMQAHLDSEKIGQNLLATQKQNAAIAVAPTPTRTPTFPPPVNSEVRTLKEQGLQLAKNINDWIATASKDAPKQIPVVPPPGLGAPTRTDYTAAENYSKRLDSEWKTKFEQQALSLQSTLHTGGIPSCRAGGEAFSETDFPALLILRKSCANIIEGAAMRLN